MAKQRFKNETKNKTKDIWLYGMHPVTLALQNKNRVIKEVWATHGAAAELNVPKNIPLRLVDRSQIDAAVGRDAVHQGVALKAAPLEAYTLDDLLADTENDDKALAVILDQVTDPHNIGAIMRSAVAFNAKAVIVPDAGAPEETGTLAKSASGALELIPLIKVSNLARAMEALKKSGFWCIGMDGYAKETLSAHKLPQKCVIVMGSEGDGLRRLTAENCDYMVKLPMNEAIESLNVSNACAIALYEYYRTHNV